MQKDGIKDRKYQGVLYPDSESYCCDDVLNILKSTFPEFAYILHDKDVDESGELKKPHIHWVGRLKAARYLAALADDLGIAENMIERCRSFDAFIRYLIHADDPDKFHYPLEAVISTFPINKFFRDDEEIQAGRLADYIIDARCSSMSNAVRWALKNGCWGTLRRAGSIWSAVISENRVLNKFNYGQYVDFLITERMLRNTVDYSSQLMFRILSGVTHHGSSSEYRDNSVLLQVLKEYSFYDSVYSFLLWGEDADGSLPQRFGSIYWTNTEKLSDYGSTYYGNGKGGSGGPFNNGYLILSESLIDGDIDAVVRTLKMNDGYAFWKNGTAKHYFNYSQAPSNSSNPIPLGQWVNMAIVNDGSAVKYYMNGVQFTPPSNWQASTGNLKKMYFYGAPGFAYSYYDELRISKGALYRENYTPGSAPFDIPMALVLPSEKTEGAIAVKSAVAVNNVRLGGVRPSYPAQGDVYISLDADKKVTSCQQYQSGTWTECQGSVCDNDTWVDLSKYSFAGQVVNEDDFAEVIDKKEDPAAGTDANPEAEATSFTVHYYKEGTTDKVRRDTVYQNLAVGAAFTASAPTVKGYKALAASAEITVTADGEHIFYYSVDESTDPGGSDDDPSKPGFFDGLLSSVKSLVNVICGFVGGVVQSLLSGITGIISTLIDAFKAVLSLGGHFGDFLAAALGFVPREIIDLLIAGIAVSIALAIIKFIRG